MAQSFEELSQERKDLQAKGWLPDWYTTQSWQMFKAKYAVAGEQAVYGRHKTIAKTLAKHMIGNEAYWEEKFFNLMWKGWLSPSTPVLSNCGTDRGLTVSCSGQYVGDSVDSFYKARHEWAILSKNGFGCSADFSDIRPRGAAISKGGTAEGPIPWMIRAADDASLISQGGNRRGSIATYLDIEHPDFDEMNDKLLAEPDGLNIGWTITDGFVAKLKTGDEEAERRFTAALYTKLVVGKGYFFFIDKANRHRPSVYKDLGLDIKASNLCTEIMLHSSESLTFSCVLSSMNAFKWDEWKDTSAVFDSTVFLDCVVSDFLEKSAGIPGLEKVRKFTEKGRAIGLGILGWGTYLQAKRIPFESLDAHFMNIAMFKKLHDDSLDASKWLAVELGEPEWLKGRGERMTHRTAQAPTKSTSGLMGNLSEAVFPEPGMVYEQGSAAGGMHKIIPEIYKIMVERGVYSKETCDDIVAHVGSVQHVTWLDDFEKEVFKTAFEIDQRVLLRHATVRQPWLCQGQSLNFFWSEDGDEDRIAEVMTEAFLEEDCLSVYYFYSRSGVIVNSVCSACEA